ncbi:MAG: hypothetical protein KDK48_01405 [Chlamydiia bacterium]|nr:hypothetical protein [Chlamydiia bacterium]
MRKLFLAILFVPTAVFASCCGEATIEGEFLWWKPCTDSRPWAAQETEDGTFDYKQVCLDREAGIRGTFAKENVVGGLDLRISYSYLKSTGRDKLESKTPNIFSTLAHAVFPGEANPLDNIFDLADVHRQMRYNAFDAVLYTTCPFCYLELTPFIGFAGFFIEQEIKSRFANRIVPVTFLDTLWNSQCAGFGMTLGSGGVYHFSCFDVYGKAQGALFAARPTVERDLQTFAVIGGDEIATLFQGSECGFLVASWNLAVGLAYNWTWMDGNFSAHAGYEAVWYHNLPRPRAYMAESGATAAALSTSPTLGTLGLHGLVLGVDVSF